MEMERKFIPLSVPNLKGNELKYVTHAVETEWVSSGGAYVSEFEDKIAQYVGAKGAVSCQNGTSGLHIALMLMGVEAGDEVIVPTLTFIAAVNPISYIGASPIFMDCDETLTLDPVKLKAFCEAECNLIDGKLINHKTGKHIKALIVVHVFGNMADMVEIKKIAASYNLKIVEDATEALGTYYTRGPYQGKYAGTIGDIGVYSFNGNKIITTGGGGMIVSNDADILEQAQHLTTQAKSDEVYYTHDAIGYNYRMTNLQAGLGLAQLELLEQFIEIKKKNYDLYCQCFRGSDGLKMLSFRPDIRPNYWFYSLYVTSNFKLLRNELISSLQKKKIQTRPVWGLIHEQIPYKDAYSYKVVMAKDYVDHVINLPCSSNLTEDEVLYVSNQIKEMGSR
jgi:aminotransferase in exopolysaccharide biosynthesis